MQMKIMSVAVLTMAIMLGVPMSVSAVDVEFVSAASGDRKPPFSTAVRVDNMLYLSGALGFVQGKLAEGGTGPETTAALENIKRNLEANGSSLGQVVKCTVFLADIADFGAMNTEYVKFFPENPPARSAMAVAGLALDANVEIECMAWVE
jgi:2-iminobutanoate/2-iminopropanoate deaminase